MSKNRIYQTTVTKRPKGIRMPAWGSHKSDPPARSWWTAHAAPTSRESFMVALRERIAEREHKDNSANWRAVMGARRSAGMQS